MNAFIRLFLLLSFFLTSFIALQAQPAATQLSPSEDEGQRPAIGSLTGQILDAQTEKPLAFASVVLMGMDDGSVVGGTLSDEKGRFSMEKVKAGTYQLIVKFMGYRADTLREVKLSPRQPRQDLGRIMLSPADYQLDEVEIVAEQEFMEVAIDRKVYNTDKLITAQGGVATDLLQNIPSVEVDIEGNVSLRGSGNVNILIDGRPSGLTGDPAALLQQLPANTIERIEVITNPSAKYDPDGMSGILNIVLKRNRRLGINGNVELSAGTQSTREAMPALLPPNKYNGSLALNFRNQKFNAFANYSYRNSQSISFGTTFRENYFGGASPILDQDEFSERQRGSQLLRTGFDLYLSPKQTLSFTSTLSQRDRGEIETGTFEFRTKEGVIDSLYERISLGDRVRRNLEANLNYEAKFDEKGKHKLVAGLNYSAGNGESESNFSSNYLDRQYKPVGDPFGLQNTYSQGTNQVITLQLDYEKPLKNKGKLEAGYKSILRSIRDDFTSETFNPAADAFLSDTFLNNDFRYAENIHSVYGIVGQQFDRLGYQLGLRVEQTFTTSELITTLDTFENDYFSLFPSAFLTYKLSQASQLQLNYSRRINRPRTRQLNPFPDLEDPFNIRRGNPFLLPEYIDAFELGYAFNKKRQTVTASLYYRMMHDMIQRIRRIDTLTNVSTRTYENLSSGTSLGVELVYVGKLTKWLNFNSSFNFFRSVIDGGENLNNRGYGYTGRMMATFRLPKSYNLQLSGFYRGPSPTAQGRRNGMGSINLAVQKRILKDKGNISLNVRDIFNIMRFQVDIDDPLFYQVFDRKWETRQATLTFSYRFGKQQFEQRRRGGRRGGGDDGMDMDF